VSRARDLVFIGDVHLEPADPALSEFLRFLERLADTADRIVLMGDLFVVWVGDRELEEPHQTAVVEQLASLRRKGVRVRYLEGNRDFRVAETYAGTALDDAPVAGIEERAGPRRLFAIHGDLANPADRAYRAWRSASRSGVMWSGLRLLPLAIRRRAIAGLERRLRGANVSFKGAFPEEVVRAYAAPRIAEGHDAVVLGHFHTERDLPVEADGRRGRVLVLPEWRESRRHLRATAAGEIEFVDS
jgi:UDP-2,3-diacylglucosamine hydrolase